MTLLHRKITIYLIATLLIGQLTTACSHNKPSGDELLLGAVNAIESDSLVTAMFRTHQAAHAFIEADDTLRLEDCWVFYTEIYDRLQQQQSAYELLQEVIPKYLSDSVGSFPVKDRYAELMDAYRNGPDSLRANNTVILADYSMVLFDQKMHDDHQLWSAEHQQRIYLLEIGIAVLALVVILTLFVLYVRTSRLRQRLLRSQQAQQIEEINRRQLENELLQLKLQQQASQLQEISEQKQAISQELASQLVPRSDAPIDRLRSLVYSEQKPWLDALAKEHPDLTDNDLLMLGMMRMGLSNSEIASALSITPRSFTQARYRLRKKLAIPDLDSLMK